MAGNMRVLEENETPPIDYGIFSDAWQNLLAFFGKVSQFPVDEQSFENSYGSFENKQDLNNFVNACVKINDQADRLGSPTSLKQHILRDPDYVLKNTPPDEVYSNLVWLSSHIKNVATSFNETLNQLPILLNPEAGNAKQRADNLKLVLTGNDGLTSLAEKINNETLNLNNKINPIETDLMEAFLIISKTTLLNEANQEIGKLESVIGRLQEEVEKAKDTWEKAILSRDKKKEIYDNLKNELDTSRALLLKKQSFTGTLNTDFFTSGNNATPLIQRIENNLTRIGKIFTDEMGTLGNMCEISTDKQLSDYEWVAESLNLTENIQKWQEIREESEDFIQQSMITV